MDAIPFDLLPLPQGLGISIFPDGTVVGRFLRSDLSSVFQPLIDSNSGACVGHEAFVRVHGRGDLGTTPWNLFSLVANDDALVALDRLCRFVHTLNFLRASDTPGRFFLNVHGRLLAAVREDHGHTFHDALDKFHLDPASVVIETPESANTDRTLVALVLSNYRLNGFAVAADIHACRILRAAQLSASTARCAAARLGDRATVCLANAEMRSAGSRHPRAA